MLRALDEMTVEGVSTTIPAHKVLLSDSSFVAGSHHTRSIEDEGILDDLVVEAAPEVEGNVLIVQGRPVRLWNPGMAASASAAVHGAVSDEDLIAPMQGTILSVLIEPGQKVETGQPAFVLEAMKMETTIAVARAGTVVELRVAPGDGAAAGQLLAVIE